jgi:hypothetical protein
VADAATAGGQALTLGGKTFDFAKIAIFGGSAGVGFILAQAAYKLAESQPSAVVEVVRGWGPLGVIGIVGMVLVDRRWAQSIEAHGKVAESQQVLAVAVQKIADKDDQRIREQELVLDHLSKTNEKIFTTLEAMRDALPPRAKAQGAGI